ncbi:hypothetical protein JYU34_013993 [Plutella xylostella]|uniref:Uncharacterized protein n=1 Tax=Plutella xylostella TaxID=51655 RepID=A0ABQ7Q7E2_PLUXY|nr:hypothetical protein JYU34_013993 [Plutella xylostella]
MLYPTPERITSHHHSSADISRDILATRRDTRPVGAGERARRTRNYGTEAEKREFTSQVKQ